MPITRVKLQDGRIVRIRVSEGTTSEQISSFVQQNLNQITQSQEPQATQPQTTQQTPTQTQQQPEAGFLASVGPGIRNALQFGATVAKPQPKLISSAARGALQGATFLPTVAADLAALGVNAAFDTDIPFASDLLSKGLSAIGLPEPETGGERIVEDIAGGVVGGAGIAKGLQALGSRVPKIIQQLVAKPAVEAIASGVSAGAVGGIRELGGGLGLQVGAGLVGGIGAGAGASRALRARVKGKPADLLADIGERGIDEPIAFVQVREGLQKEANTLRERISGKFVIRDGQRVKVKSGLFDEAVEKGKNAFVNNEQISELSASFERQAIGEVDNEVKDILLSASKVLDDIMKSSKPHLNDNIAQALNAGQQLEKTFVTRGITGVASTTDDLSRTFKQVNELEGLRRSASRIANSGGSRGYGGGQVLGEIDNFLENATIIGDQNTVGLWGKAIRARREFAQKFEIPKKIAQAVDSDQTIETVEKLFLGSGAVTSKAEIAKTYDETLRALQPNQRQKVGFALRQSVVNRMIRSAAQRSDSKEGLSAATLSNSINNLRRDNRTLWNKFTVKERGELTKLETELTGLSDVAAVTKTAAWILSRTPSGALPGVAKPLTELPRTIRLKNIVTVKDLLKLSASRPTPTARSSIVLPSLITTETIEEQQ